MKPYSPDVTTYMDFRVFLKDSYEGLRRQNPKFSHRYFCLKAGYNSSGGFADILADMSISVSGIMLQCVNFFTL